MMAHNGSGCRYQMKCMEDVKRPLMGVRAKAKGDSVHGERSHDPVRNWHIKKAGRITKS
jgi:hypothetical protein